MKIRLITWDTPNYCIPLGSFLMKLHFLADSHRMELVHTTLTHIECLMIAIIKKESCSQD